jgi:hypothetical protein
MIGERLERHEVATSGAQRPLHPPRLGDTGETDLPTRRRRGGDPPRDPHRFAGEDREQIGIRDRHVRRKKDHHGIGADEAGGQRLAQGTGGDHAAIAERPLPVPRLAIDDDEGQGLGQGRVLVAVVHDHDIAARGDGQASAGEAIAGDDDRTRMRHQQRLVAYLGGAMTRAIHQDRPAKTPPITGRQQDGAHPRLF